VVTVINCFVLKLKLKFDCYIELENALSNFVRTSQLLEDRTSYVGFAAKSSLLAAIILNFTISTDSIINSPSVEKNMFIFCYVLIAITVLTWT